MRKHKNRFQGVDMKDVTAVFTAAGAKPGQSPYMFGKDRRAFLPGTCAGMILSWPAMTPELRAGLALSAAQLYHLSQAAAEQLVDLVREKRTEGWAERLIEIENEAFASIVKPPKRVPAKVEDLPLEELNKLIERVEAAKAALQVKKPVRNPIKK